MRKFLILICILIPYCCFSQFFEDFSNAELFEKNHWQGDISHFRMEQNALHLNRSVTESTTYQSYLSAPVSLPEGSFCWEIEARLDFNPSKDNHACFYLISDSPTPTQAVNGYFLQLGGKEDELKVCKQEGAEITTLLDISQKLTALNMNHIRVKVMLKGERWEVYSCYNFEQDFRKEGGFTERLDRHTGYVSWLCNYTKGNATRFYLNSVSVKPGEDIVLPPTDKPDSHKDTIYIERGTQLKNTEAAFQIDSVEVLNTRQFLIHFNREVNISKASLLISPDNLTPAIAPTQYRHIVHASIAEPLQTEILYTMGWIGVYDLQGNLFQENLFQFIIGDSKRDERVARFGEIVISEIMANPKGCVLLPEAEYVELLNRSDRTFSLTGCRFYYDTKSYELPLCTLNKGERVILCHASVASLFAPDIHTLAIPNFAVISNSGKLLYLENQEGDLLHWIEYSDKWYANNTQKAGGCALEMIDSDFLWSNGLNWSGSVASAGGTPGRANSLEGSNPDSSRPFLAAHGIESATHLSLRFSKSMRVDLLRNAIRETWPTEPEISATDYPQNRSFRIEIPTDASPEVLRILLADIACIDGLTLFDCGEIVFGVPEAAQKGDCCINELLWTPPAEGVPFVELYNHSDKLLDLYNLRLAILDADSAATRQYPLVSQTALFAPGEYALISPDPQVVFEQYGYEGVPRIVEASAFPEITGSVGNIALITSKGEKIDALYYRKALHSASASDLTGVSLERRNPLVAASVATNWTSGHSSTRYGTPGYKNRADAEPDPSDMRGLEGSACFRLLNERLRLQESSPESELVLLYRMDHPNMKLTATLYTSNGLKVCRLATNQELDTEGELVWPTQWRTERSKTPGIYLLLVEYLSAEGKSGREKIVIPVVP